MSAVYNSQHAADDLKDIFSASVFWPKGSFKMPYRIL